MLRHDPQDQADRMKHEVRPRQRVAVLKREDEADHEATAAAANPSVAIAARPSRPDQCCPNKVNAADTVSVADAGMLLLVAGGGGVCFGERCAVHSLPSQ